MAATTTNDLKRGMTLDLPEGLFHVVDFQHVKPGKGPAFVRTTLRNARTGGQLDRTFRADERVEQAVVDKKEMQFLYQLLIAYYILPYVGIDLPAAVELTVSDTDPGIQGDRVSGARKPATLETGLVVQVPLFVNPGDRIKVDTRSAEYLTRA